MKRKKMRKEKNDNLCGKMAYLSIFFTFPLFALIFSSFSLNFSSDFSILKNPNRVGSLDRKSTRLNSSHSGESRMPSSA